MEKLSHYDAEGSAHMVDVSAKAATRREAELRPSSCCRSGAGRVTR